MVPVHDLYRRFVYLEMVLVDHYQPEQLPDCFEMIPDSYYPEFDAVEAGIRTPILLYLPFCLWSGIDKTYLSTVICAITDSEGMPFFITLSGSVSMMLPSLFCLAYLRRI